MGSLEADNQEAPRNDEGAYAEFERMAEEAD